jgi:glycosyltransferase involved in cell wall biosynthesis
MSVPESEQDCIVSIVIPCFNASQELRGAVQSILDQGLAATEIIIVDDQSTDDSVAVAEDLAARHPEVRVIRQPANAGPAAARNAGLRVARGRYIGFLDADDEYAPDFFASIVPMLEKDRSHCGVITGLELVDCHREIHPVQYEALVSSIPCNLLIRKAAADLLGGFPEAPAFRGEAAGEDYAFKQALTAWFKVKKCEQPFLRHRVKRGSHLDYFLDRSRVVDGKLVFTNRSPEEQSGALASALSRYLQQVRERVMIVSCLKGYVYCSFEQRQ